MSKVFPGQWLHLIRIRTMMKRMTKPKNTSEEPEEGEKPKKVTLKPLPILQDDEPSIDQEMEDLFNEDRVTHRHGSTEPERD